MKSLSVLLLVFAGAHASAAIICGAANENKFKIVPEEKALYLVETGIFGSEQPATVLSFNQGSCADCYTVSGDFEFSGATGSVVITTSNTNGKITADLQLSSSTGETAHKPNTPCHKD